MSGDAVNVGKTRFRLFHCGRIYLFAVLFALLVAPSDIAAAESVKDLVEAPPLLSPPDDSRWDYLSRYFMSNTYTAIRDNNYSQANEFIGKVIESRPSDSRVLQIAVHIRMRQELWPEAESALSKLLELNPDMIPAWVRRGYVRGKLGNYRGARDDYQEVLARNPSPELKKYAEDALSRAESKLDAAEQKKAAAWKTVQPKTAELEREGRWAEAEAELAAFLESWPDSDQALFARGEARFEQRHYNAAAADYRSALALHPGPAIKSKIDARLKETEKEISFWLGVQSLKEKGDLAGLDRLLSQRLETKPGDVAVLVLRGYTRYHLGLAHLNQARADLAAALANPVLASGDRANVEGTLTRIDEQIQLAGQQQFLAVMIPEVRPDVGVGAALPPPEKAVPAKATPLVTEWDKVLLAEKELRDRRDWPELERLYTDLIDRDDHAGLAYSKRGFLRLQEGNPDGARKDFEAALARGVPPETKGEIETAMVRLDATAPIDEEWASIQRAETGLRDKQDWDGLDRFYTDLIGREAYAAFAHAGRGYLRLQRGMVDEARHDFEEALARDLHPDTRSGIELTLARLEGKIEVDDELSNIQQTESELREKQDWAGLDRFYTDLTQRERYAGYAYSGRGFLRLQEGKQDEAKGDFELALSKGVTPETERAIKAALDQEEELAGILRTESDLREKQDWAGLDRFYTDLTQRERYAGYAYSGRGFLRLQEGKQDEAKSDFELALAKGVTPETKRNIETALTDIDEFAEIQRTEEELREKKDWEGLDRFYTDLLTVRKKYVSYAASGRGFLRLQEGHDDEAKKDFATAMEYGVAPSTRRDIEIALTQMNEWEDIRRAESDLTEKKDWAGLDRFYSELAGRKGFAAYSYSGRGFLRLQEGKEEEARKDFEEALKHDATPAIRRNVEGAIAEMDDWAGIRRTESELRDKKDWEGLDRFYTDLTRRAPYIGYAYSGRGFLRLQEGREKEAREDFEEALKNQATPAVRGDIETAIAEMDEWGAIQRTEREFRDKQDWDGLEKFYTDLAQRERFAGYAYSGRGFLRLQEGKEEEARKDFEQALSLGVAPATRRDIEAAVTQMDEWAAIQRTEAALREKEDWEGLDAFYTDLANRKEYTAYAYSGRGFLRLQEGKSEEARKDFEAALSHGPALATRGDIEAAVIQMDEWAAIQRTEAELRATEDWDGLDRFYTDLAKREPYAAYAYAGRGYLRVQQGRMDEARKDFESALSRGPTPATRRDIEAAVAQMGEWAAIQRTEEEFREKKDWEALDRFYTDLIENERYAAHAYAGRGFLRLQDGKEEEARKDFGEALARNIAPETRRGIEKAIAEIDEWQAIRRTENELKDKQDWLGLEEYYTGLVRRGGPYDAYAYAGRGFLRLQEGRTAEARSDFEQAKALGIGHGTLADIESVISQMDDWETIQKTEAELRAKKDWENLERYYTELAERGDPYAGYAHSGRGFLRMQLGRTDEGKKDLEIALARGVAPETKRSIEGILFQMDEWGAIQRTESELRGKRDWPGLEQFYSELTERKPYIAYAYSGRGFLRLQEGRIDEAKKDLEVALASNPAPETRRSIESALARLDAGDMAPKERETVRKRADELAKNEDWTGVERLYDDAVGRYPDDAFFLTMRGIARLDVGRGEEAREDFNRALTLEPDKGIGDLAKEMLRNIDDALARGEPLGSAKVEEYLTRIGELIDANKHAEAAPIVAKLEEFPLTDSQAGRRDFYAAEILWAAGNQDAAYALYSGALGRLKDHNHQRSEALWKIAEYHLARKERDLALEYARQSISANPDFVWRNIAAGNMYSSLGMDCDAIYYYEKALGDKSLTAFDMNFLQSLARSYWNVGDRESYKQYMRRQIDIDTEKTYGKPVLQQKEIEDLYRLRREYADTTKRFTGFQFLYYNQYNNGDYAIRYQNELKYRFWYKTMRFEAYLQTMATLDSSFSGEYWDPFSWSYMPYNGRTNIKDGINVAAGLRYFPFANLDLSVALDKVFKIGPNVVEDTRLHLAYNDSIGDDWEPIVCSWPYAVLWTDAVYSLEHNDFTFWGEGRWGRNYRLDRVHPRMTITPFLGAVAGYGGKEVRKSERISLEAGPGVMLRQWFDEDKYNAPRQHLDFVIQYRFGLTKGRSNVLSFVLTHSF